MYQMSEQKVRVFSRRKNDSRKKLAKPGRVRSREEMPPKDLLPKAGSPELVGVPVSAKGEIAEPKHALFHTADGPQKELITPRDSTDKKR